MHEITEDDQDAGEGLLDNADEIATKLDLARAYMDMGDPEGARSILDEVMGEGNDDQKREAEEIISKLG
jgi:pilus assembly protein FimV